MQNGVLLEAAAEQLGHLGPALFFRLYSHVTSTMQVEAAERVSALLFGPSASP